MNFAAQQAIYDSDLRAVIPEMPVTFYFNGVAYVGNQTPGMSELIGQDAGYLEQFDFELIAPVSIFSTVTPPVVKDTLEIPNADGKARTSYKVEKLTPSQDGVSLTFSMTALN